MSPQRMLTALALSAALTTLPAWGGQGWGQGATSAPTQALDTDEAATLTFMREEERLARDLYLQFDGLGESALFVNISAAEQRHMDAVKVAMDRYGIAEPSDPTQVGQYANTELGKLHSELLAQGSSYLGALWAAGMVEEVDIDDLRNAIDETDNEDLQTIYGNLLRGSRNHLRAFAGEIERQGAVYEAQFLEQDDVDDILNSPMERGPGGKGKEKGQHGGNGQGQAQGGGNGQVQGRGNGNGGGQDNGGGNGGGRGNGGGGGRR